MSISRSQRVSNVADRDSIWLAKSLSGEAMTWRDKARPIIAAVLSDLSDEPEKVIRAALRDAYPFGPKRYHPYKVWCDEIKVQMGTKQSRVKAHYAPDPNQSELFSA